MYVSAWKRAALCLACLGMILPQSALMAGETKTQSNDISLAKGGVLVGSVVDSSGRVLANAPVSVKFNGFTVATTQSNAKGQFTVRGLRGGVHEICTASGTSPNRFWAHGTAPKAAKSAAVVVNGNNVVRSQGGLGLLQDSDLLIGTMLMGGVIAGIVIGANDDDDRSSSP